MLGLALEGATRVAHADVAGGMRRLDEATTAALAGEAALAIAPAWTFCFLVSACMAVQDYERAGTWCARIGEFADRHGSRYMLAFCRAEYGAADLVRGRWAAAEALLEAAVEDFTRARPGMTGGALAALAELRRRQGRDDAARALLERAGAGASAELVRARLALDGGDARAAAERAERAAPPAPAARRALARAPALELLAHACAAAARPRRGGGRAAPAPAPPPRARGRRRCCARADLAAGAVAAAAGRHEEARRLLEDAVDGFTAAGVPYELAAARRALAAPPGRARPPRRRRARAPRRGRRPRGAPRRRRAPAAAARAERARARGARTGRRRAPRTGRSPSGSCSASTRCTATSPTSCASSISPPGPRPPPCWPARWPVRATTTAAARRSVAPMRTATTPWALGDYDRFARALVWELGAELVAACGIGPGQRVLDVAAGTGNVALRAAAAGAHVVASDMTPESLATGDRRAREAGIALESVVADAQALPFADASFDVVTSAFGAIFAPDHAAVAGELLRVCRPGGTIGMVNFTPEGNAAGFFGALAPYAPPRRPAPGSRSRGATRTHVRALLGPGTASLRLTRRTYVERHAGGADGIRRVRDRDVRARDRHARGRRRPGRAGPRPARLRDRGEHGAAGRPGRDPVRVPAGAWPSGPRPPARRRARRGTSGSRPRCRP